MSITLGQLQAQLRPWQERNFPDRPKYQPVLGVVEEVGELAHALLKWEQAIRGTPDQHEAAAKDAIGDIVVFMADVCNAYGWDFEQCVADSWAIASRRDWVDHRATGAIQV